MIDNRNINEKSFPDLKLELSEKSILNSIVSESTPSGSVFGIPLAQCVESERALRRQQHGGSRASLASLGALEKGDDVSGLCHLYCLSTCLNLLNYRQMTII